MITVDLYRFPDGSFISDEDMTNRDFDRLEREWREHRAMMDPKQTVLKTHEGGKK